VNPFAFIRVIRGQKPNGKPKPRKPKTMAKTTRAKHTTPALKTREDAESSARHAAEIIIKIRAANNEIDEKITAIKAAYELELSDLQQQLEIHTTLLKDWTDANPEPFGKSKSLDLTHATIGYRTGQPTLKTRPGWTWDRVLENLQTNHADHYIRSKSEPNKQAILGDRDTLGPEGLSKLGCRVTQDETFYVEPKLTEQPAAINAAA
jgi:phage host-nuclease inhibitor protein Gam